MFLTRISLLLAFLLMVSGAGTILVGQEDANQSEVIPDQNMEDVVDNEAEEELKHSFDKAELKKIIEQAQEDVQKEKELGPPGLIQNDAVIFGLLLAILGLVFYTSTNENAVCRKFYKYIPMLLMCYFLPSLLTLFGIVNPGRSNLYFVASRYLLPACLVLLTLSIDLKEIFKLGPKALIMFGTGTLGVLLGGPIAILIVSSFNPELVGGEGYEATWRGLSTVAGSWIGGGANQAAMFDIFMLDADMTPAETSRAKELFGVMVAVDVIVAELWMVFLLLGVGKAKEIDRLFKADASSVDRLQKKMEDFSLSTARIPTAAELMTLLGIAFGITAICHFIGGAIGPYVEANYPALKKFSLDSSFFWLIVLATTFGILLSFTKVKNYEGVGASKIGTIFIFILVATIGMNMDIRALAEHPGLFLVGGIWMLIHIGLLFLVGWLIRAPYFFLAVGSKANIGGAASAPVVAAAFHPSLAPVGVLLAVLGYALGTYAAWLCAILMQSVAPV